MQVTLIGIDLAKTIFQVCGVNAQGMPAFNRTVKREGLLKFLLQYPEATVAMEACSGSNYWGRELKGHDIKVMLIPPQHVKPFVKGNKNDRNDAFAITEAARRPNLQCVEPRSIAQTDMIQVHRLRERLVGERTGLINQLRGFMNEFGVVVSRGRQILFTSLLEMIDSPNNGLSPSARTLYRRMYDQWRYLNDEIKQLDKRIAAQAKANEDARRLMTIKGVAEKTATAVIAHAGNGAAYKNGRHFSANLGLVPKEHSSGGQQKLGSISKRGNRYLRRLLIQGAWSVMRNATRSEDRLSRWAREVAARSGQQKAVVAIANKLARIIWSMLYHRTEYRAG